MPPTAFLTGITGQDGSYLAELLLHKGYVVHGLLRRCSTHNNTIKIKHLLRNPNLELHYGDMTDSMSLQAILSKAFVTAKDRFEIYNLAALSHVPMSFDSPEYTAIVDAVGPLYILEWMRRMCVENPASKERLFFYQASSSELYGKVQEWPQKETTPFYPRSPYGVAKLYAFWIVKNYRESYGLFAVNGILFNHESPRRGEDFVTRKITIGIANILLGKQEVLEIGNLDAKRDWGHARDFVEGMWMMLQYKEPRDWVLATGQEYSVRECITTAFRLRDIPIIWEGEGIHEIGKDAKTGDVRIRVNPKFFRPAEVEKLLGDATEARTVLGWTPKTSFEALLEEMLKFDLGM
jgi:GDPmannose 4,6-dehydratase